MGEKAAHPKRHPAIYAATAGWPQRPHSAVHFVMARVMDRP
jgi:hypothetical protein